MWNSLKQLLVTRTSGQQSVSNPSTASNNSATPQPMLSSSSQSKQLAITATGHSQTYLQNNKNFILVCSKDTKWLTTWKDLDVTKLLSDQELFSRLREEYYCRKSWLKRYISVKVLCRIVFVKVC
jgi:hypothetical protein